MTTRPAETYAATIGALIAAVVAVLAAFGIEVPDAVLAAATPVVGLIAAAVTWYVARKQRDPADPTSSDVDGKVTQA